ncbi:methyltransferase-like protein 27 [Cebidichthys violaceus]|uniref:methyltransferase-like protein 27 n=1 Tax=Cebidichthys violaceus TaxID=271503 RepID=UPI0035CBD16C
MTDSCRTEFDARAALRSTECSDAKLCVQFYDGWAENYEEDCNMMCYRGPHLAAHFLSDNFSGSRGEARVLDVGCGSGWVAKLMVELGFKHFVGVDGSQGMLDLAAKTGLYKELKLALLGTEPLPAETGTFDVVILVGALNPESAPVSVVRELCNAAKPGGYVCMARGNQTKKNEFKKDLERELQLMEEEGLWSPAGLKQADRYMEDPHLNSERVKELPKEERYITGTVYLYKKSIHSN